jgi:outer membrane assembly lipoprotein YfiO
MRTAGTLALLFIVLGTSLTACKTRSREEIMTDPALVYERAHKALMGSDFPLAIKVYEALMARYPFAAETRQSRLDVIYAYYRAGESESAIDAADTFIAENPTHPRVDYAWYLKGLTDFERLPNFMERWLYHGLHSMNFPWLYNYRPAWDIVVIAFMAGGTALAFTSLMLAWQVLGRKLRLIHG